MIMHPIRTEAGYRAIFKVEAAGIIALVRTGRGFNSATSAINKNAREGASLLIGGAASIE